MRSLRRILPWPLLLLLLAYPLGGKAASQDAVRPLCAELQASSVLLAQSGEALVPPGVFRYLYELTDEEDALLFAGSLCGDAEGAFALIDAQGEPLTAFQYDLLEYAGSNAVIALRDGRYGVLNARGEELIPCEYPWILSNREGAFLAMRTDPYDDAPDGLYVLSAQGEERATGIKVSYPPSPYANGRSAAPSADGGRFGYLDASGEWAIPPQYLWASDFTDGIAVASVDSGYGLIDANGNWRLTPKYDFLSVQPDETGAVHMIVANNTLLCSSILDPKTFETLATFESAGLTGDPSVYACACGSRYAYVTVDGQALLVNAQGKTIWTANADACYYSTWGEMGELAVLYEGEYGEANAFLLSADGEKIAGPYREISPLGTHAGRLLFEVSSYEVSLFHDEETGIEFLDEVPGTRRCGALDASGQQVIPPVFTYLYPLADGYLVAFDEAQSGVINASGAWLASYPEDSDET